ncbi:thiol reductant ABC exporter subunit CydD [Liquorilactobacillus capillatus]|uniref:Transport ATP-binding protein CydC n=1 Tax=Liquorilactobacillus capillatus DSM 19910 TaxID=1423731 RepID=A0A0R1M3Y7_9LACO|nr:thiol reductant ABC exporter subunit CydD [Liquorilactobacillus capillatus]KRL02473.1 transport ATP-binding protein CydC [Liquorilactobacillus capillatus DSM 19910]
MIDKSILKFPNIKKILTLLVGITFLQACAIVGQACFLAGAIVGLWEGQQLNKQLFKILLFAVCFCVRQAITFFRERVLDHYAAEQAGELRQQLLTKIFHVGPEVVQQNGTGNVTTMVLEGIDQVENYLHLILSKIISLMIIPWVILLAILFFDWKAAAFLLAIFPVIIIFMIVLGYAAQAKADRQYKTYQLLSNHFVDSLRGIDTLKFFGLSKRYGKSIFRTSERFRVATLNTLKIAILSTFALDFFTTLSIAVVAVLLGLRLINGQMLLYPALTILILSPEYFLPIRDFSGDYHATLNGKNSLSAIEQILEIKETVTTQQQLPDWNAQSRLQITGLTFRYAEEQPQIKMTLNAEGYQKIGIIGLSGSGKSTLINLLSGFLSPTAGRIRVNGVELTSFSQHDWQQQVIYIPQNPYIFKATLRANIAFYQPEATIEQVREAIKVVGLTQLVSELSNGIDTVIGEGSRTLSGGQAQRIALARAFLDKKRKILLFDEPTAHLDIETEVELKEKMLPLMENHLVFFATHRLHWMKEMDQIIVMDAGKTIEQGTLKELKQQDGSFVHLSSLVGRL